MTEATEQRIERVARAIQDAGDKVFGTGRSVQEACVDLARVADAISFQAGWDAAVETLRKHVADMNEQFGGSAYALHVEDAVTHLKEKTP